MAGEEYICTACGARYDEHDPPCRQCAGEEFATVVAGDREDMIDDVASVRFRCTRCGLIHPRNSPPCNECGSMQFEQVDDDEPIDTGDPTEGEKNRSWPYAIAVLVVVGAVAAVFSGAIAIPGVNDTPSVKDVPGQADYAAGVNLTQGERELITRLNAERDRKDKQLLERTSGLDTVAEYIAQYWVKTGASPAERHDAYSDLRSRFGLTCSPGYVANDIQTAQVGGRPLTAYSTEAALGKAFADSFLNHPPTRQRVMDANGRVGADFHVAPDGSVYIVVVIC